jgi:hypothetical protein
MKRQALENHARVIADELRAKMLPGVGFCLIMFDFGERGNLAYMSTGDRRDTIATLREMIRVLEAS